jgi:hypothetical protein
MITLLEAYLKAKDAVKTEGRTLLLQCDDFGDVWGFEFAPPGYEPSMGAYGGCLIHTVSKKTGEIGNYYPQDDFGELMAKAKNIPLKQLKDWIPPTAKAKKKQNRVPAVAVAS